jgi:hypothetical protein
LGAIEVLALEAPVDAVFDRVKLDVERMHPVRQPRVQGA